MALYAIPISCARSIRDGAGDEVTLRNWTFEVLPKDTSIPAYGPGGRDCANGVSVDTDQMDSSFTCDCSGTKFTGENCEVSDQAYWQPSS